MNESSQEWKELPQPPENPIDEGIVIPTSAEDDNESNQDS